MTTGKTRPQRRAPGRAWVRHATAMLLAIVLNGALLGMLIAWRGRGARAAAAPVRTVAIRVAEETQPAWSPPPAGEPEARAAAAPVARQMLPAPPMPEMPAPALRLPAPPTLEMPPSASFPAGVPLYSAEPAADASLSGGIWPSGAPGPPAAPSSPRAGPAGRAPSVIEPPDLSSFYPRRARVRGITGKTTIRLTVTADGRVADVQVLAGTPGGTFEAAARRVGRSLRFRPALRDGKPVAATTTLELVWRLEN